jgi:TrmH family RNA methyltransferase
MQQLGRHSERLRELRRRIRERRPGEVVVDGRRLVQDVLRWRVPILELYLSSSLTKSQIGQRLAAATAAVWEVEDSVLAAVAPTRHPQGVLAIVSEPMPRVWPSTNGVGVFIEGVQEPGNVGSIVRAAAALGAQAVFMSNNSADPFHWAAVRGSAGAVFKLPPHRDADLVQIAARVRSTAGSVWATASSGTPIAKWEPPRPLLLLLGAEGSGLSPQALSGADGTVAIPMDRGVDSLNVAVAAGILLQRLRA